jgi:hypothetical protein
MRGKGFVVKKGSFWEKKKLRMLMRRLTWQFNPASGLTPCYLSNCFQVLWYRPHVGIAKSENAFFNLSWTQLLLSHFPNQRNDLSLQVNREFIFGIRDEEITGSQ